MNGRPLYKIFILCIVPLLASALSAGQVERECDFPIVDGSNLDWSEFEHKFFRPRKPVLIQNAVTGWPAFDVWKWNNLEAFFRQTPLRVGPGPYPDTEMTIKEYLDLIEREKNSTSLPGIFQYGQVPTSWTLWSYKEDCIPYVAFFHPNSRPLHDNTSFVCDSILRNIRVPAFLVGNEHVKKPPAHITHSGLLIGVPGSGIDFHSHQDAINVVFYGKKQWYMKVPRQSLDQEPDSCKRINSSVCQNSHGELARILGVKPTEKEEQDALISTCVQHVGEVVYIPDGIQHGVINIENTVAMQMQWPSDGWNNENDRAKYKAYLLHAVDPTAPDPKLTTKEDL